MKTLDDIFKKAGGSGKMAGILGVKPSAASEMRRRGSIPVPHWPRLVKHFEGTNEHLDNDMLVRIHAGKKRKPKVAPEQGSAA